MFPSLHAWSGRDICFREEEHFFRKFCSLNNYSPYARGEISRKQFFPNNVFSFAQAWKRRQNIQSWPRNRWWKVAQMRCVLDFSGIQVFSSFDYFVLFPDVTSMKAQWHKLFDYSLAYWTRKWERRTWMLVALTRKSNGVDVLTGRNSTAFYKWKITLLFMEIKTSCK